MKVNTGLPFLFAGVDLLRRSSRDLPIYSLAVLLIGAATAAEYLSNLTLASTSSCFVISNPLLILDGLRGSHQQEGAERDVDADAKIGDPKSIPSRENRLWGILARSDGKLMNLFEVSKEISDRLVRIFTRDEHGRRPVYGGAEIFQSDPHWRDYILFYEYFHGDNGAGLGASHQTGWTGLVAKTIQLFGLLDAKRSLEAGKQAAFVKGAEAPHEVKVAVA